MHVQVNLNALRGAVFNFSIVPSVIITNKIYNYYSNHYIILCSHFAEDPSRRQAHHLSSKRMSLCPYESK